jgi:uncharacterized protein
MIEKQGVVMVKISVFSCSPVFGIAYIRDADAFLQYFCEVGTMKIIMAMQPMKQIRIVRRLFALAMLLGCILSSSAQSFTKSFRETELDFDNRGDSVFGKLILPQGELKGNLPVIVFVHGSGPEDYSSSGNYDYLFQEFVDAGYACYSWDKPGTGRSKGQWYTQSITDRSQEVLSAIKKLKTESIIDSSRIGLWGISQAGWVMPLVAGQVNLRFVICVSSPVTTAFDQELYRVGAEMKIDGYSKDDLDKAIAYTKGLKNLVLEDKPYSDFLRLQKQIENEKWRDVILGGDEMLYQYVKVILREDNVPRIGNYHCPVLAVWGENDLQVPPKKSFDVFQIMMKEMKNPDYTGKIIPRADHTLTFNLTGKHAETIERRNRYKEDPQKIFAPGAVELMTGWLKARRNP